MVNDSYFYNATIRKTIAVFGALFNNIYTGKLIDSKLTNIARVPLAYGPRERFLVRIRQADNSDNADVAIKLPRMSFEINSLSFDAANKLNKTNIKTFETGDNGERTVVRQASPYILGISLNVMSRGQDDALQVLEQIIPAFDPTYTITVKEFEGPGTKTDLPITLNSVALQDEYEGDFESGRRTIIYTLDFSLKIKFIGSITTLRKVIKSITVDLYNGNVCDDPDPIDRVNLELGDPINDTADDFTVINTYGFD
jgi:hypothetical protein